MIMVVIQTQDGQPLPVASDFSSHHAVLAAVMSLERETTVGPQEGQKADGGSKSNDPQKQSYRAGIRSVTTLIAAK
jgi:hypothetical protein